MISMGIIRKIDEMGRLVLPKEIRKKIGMNEGDPIEFFTDGDKIILKKYVNACVFCSSTDNMVMYKEKMICGECAEKIMVQTEMLKKGIK